MVRIITDSAADFEPFELKKYNISCIPLTVHIAGQDRQENVDLSKDQFYELLAASGELPVTAQASPQILIDLFQDATDAGDEAVYITLSSALSGTFNNAVMVRNMVGNEANHVLDSRNATGGQRILVEYAVRLRDEGCSAAQIVERVSALRNRIHLYACIDTLKNLYQGGRISHTAYTLGSMAQIKPIIRVEYNGGIGVPAKVMGMRKGMDRLCKELQSQPLDPDFPLYVMYTSRRSTAEELARQFRALGYDIPDAHIIQVGAAIGTHIGPDACGFVGVKL